MSASLASELARPLSPLELSIGGSASRRPGEIDQAAAMAIWGLLAYVLTQEHAPRPAVVVRWRADQRAAARSWGERELARAVLGKDGCPSRTIPPVLARYVERWEAAGAVPSDVAR